MVKSWRFPGLCIAMFLGMAVNAGAQNSLNSPYPEATNLTPPTYNYEEGNSCATCHFIFGVDHMPDAVGLTWNSTANEWRYSGGGWYASWHAQSDHRETRNTFCAKCHSPLQAAPSASISLGNVNAVPVPDGAMQAVTCGTCHPSDPVASVIAAQNPNAFAGGAVSLYRWKGYENPAAYQPILNGQEDTLCLSCHEVRHNTDNVAFQAMYSANVRCIDCHMAVYNIFGGGTTGYPPLPERAHDWKVAQNLPYSCGAQGSISGYSCHSEFTADAANSLIPFIKEQHFEWWSLPPFNGTVVAMASHRFMTVAKYRLLWQEIARVDSTDVQ